MLEFRLLGPLEVVGDDGPLPLGGLRQRAILAALLLRAGQVVPTERLVHDVWGEERAADGDDVAPERDRGAAQAARPERARDPSPGYVLRVERGQVDSARFEQLLARRADGQPEERAAMLRRRSALWRGPALADLAYDDFAQAEIRAARGAAAGRARGADRRRRRARTPRRHRRASSSRSSPSSRCASGPASC